MGTLWLGGAEGLICPKFYTDNHKHPPPPWTLPAWRHPPSQNLKNTPTLGHSQAPPPLGHCLCDVIIHIPKGLICSFLWPIFSSCFARISPTVCPNFTHCLPEFHPLFARIWGGAAAPPCPPASYAYAYQPPLDLDKLLSVTGSMDGQFWYQGRRLPREKLVTACTLFVTIILTQFVRCIRATCDNKMRGDVIRKQRLYGSFQMVSWFPCGGNISTPATFAEEILSPGYFQ